MAHADVVGIDGGKSGIRMRHSSTRIVVEVPGVSHEEGDAVTLVADAVARGWQEAGFAGAGLIVMGLTTAPSDPMEADRLCRLVGRATGTALVWLADDAVTAHAGALSLGWGVSLVAGTGVACLALPDAGEPRIIGGHGHLLGDEGGAFWIGRAALNAVLRATEGRGPQTVLAGAAIRRYGVLDGLHVRLHAADRPVAEIAAFAPDVMDAAAGGDQVAGSIVDAAARELADLAATATDWAGRRTQEVPLALGGRLMEPGSLLRRRVDDALAARGLAMALRSADHSPLDGAVMLGLAGDDHPYGDLVHTWAAAASHGDPA